MSNWIKRDKEVVWHPFTQMQIAKDPICIVKAKDSVLTDIDGNEYLDCNSCWWVNVHGHGNEAIAKAISEQLTVLDHVIFAGVTHTKAIELSERVVKLLPEHFTKVFFSDDGSTAVEVALKMAFQFWYNKGNSKKRMLAIDGAYHGDTFGAMSVGQRGYFNEPFEHFFFDVDFIDFPTIEKETELLKSAEEKFKTNEFAALIVEPLIQGSSGMRIYSSHFLDELVRIARKYEVLVIFDEVMTGWGRTGTYFAMDQCEEKPDIVCLSKGLTGGVLPLGLTVSSERIYEAFLADEISKALLHGHSFTGNAIACAASCASLDVFEMKETWNSIKRIEQAHSEFLNRIKDHKMIHDLRMLGTIFVIEIKTDSSSSYFSSISDQAHEFFLKKGCMLRALGNVIFLNPPYSTTTEQLEIMHTSMKEFLDSLLVKS